jgi:hypothetical protein
MTVQSAVIGSVVKVLPLSVPPQVPATKLTYPGLGVRVNDVVAKPLTDTAVAGLMVPSLFHSDTLGVTVYVPGVKLAITVQSLVIGLVVKILPLSVPPQVPPTDEAIYPALGNSINVGDVKPGTDNTVAELIAPPTPDTLGVTV